MTWHRTIVLSLIALTTVLALLYVSGFEAEATPDRAQPGPWSEQAPAGIRPAGTDEQRLVVATAA